MAVVRLLFSSSSSLLLLSAPTLRHTFEFLQPRIRFDTFPQADSVLRLRCSHRLLVVDSGSNLELDPSLHESTSDQASLNRAPALIKDPDRNGRKTPATDYLGLSDEDLLAQCKMDTFRASGPGGQHRNKTNSAVRLRHTPTGLMSQAAEDRSQHRNRVYALRRLRQLISLKVRCPVNLENYSAPPELVRILPIPKRLQGNVQQIGPHHEDFSKGAQCLLDLIWEVEGSISSAAKLLSLSTGALNKVIASEKLVLQTINQLRVSKGMKPLH